MARPRLLILDEPSLGWHRSLCSSFPGDRNHPPARGDGGAGGQNARSALRIADDAYNVERPDCPVRPAQQLMHDAAVQNAYLGAA
jgi:ABC-type branched-subunit amino acid transport system ATPase component